MEIQFKDEKQEKEFLEWLENPKPNPAILSMVKEYQETKRLRKLHRIQPRQDKPDYEKIKLSLERLIHNKLQEVPHDVMMERLYDWLEYTHELELENERLQLFLQEQNAQFLRQLKQTNDRLTDLLQEESV